jgi:O-antigen ligase
LSFPRPLCGLFLALYLLATPFTKLFHTPGLGYALQLPELLFVAFIAAAAWQRAYRFQAMSLMDWALIGLGLSQAIAAAAQPGFWGNHALYGLGYLLLLCHVGRVVLAGGGQDIPGFLRRGMKALAWVLSVSIALSLLYHAAYPAGGLELVEPKYMPFIGWVQRVEALTMSPNMLMNLLMLPFLVLAGDALYRRAGRSEGLLLVLLPLGMLATFSKSILLAGTGLLGLLALRFARRRWQSALLGSTALVFALAFVLFSKALLVGPGAPSSPATQGASYATGELLFEAGGWQAYKTMHLWLNEEALALYRAHPLLGIGPGRFTQHIDGLKAAGLYPAEKLSFGPHSLYFGVLAQSGTVGAAGLLLFILAMLRNLRALWRVVPDADRGLAAGLAAYLLIWLLEGISMDTLHFRHFWWALLAAEALRVASQRQRRLHQSLSST